MSKPIQLLVLLVVLAALAGWLFLRRDAAAPAGPRQDASESNAGPAHVETARPAPAAPLETAVDPAGARDPIAGAREDAGLARVRLRLVDEATREPVPFFVVQLRHSTDLLESLESDAQGLLLGKRGFAPGEYLLDFSAERRTGDLIQTRAKEARALPGTLPLVLAAADASAPAPDLAIPVGPSFAFQASWPGGLAPGSFTAQLSGADPRLAFDKLYAPLRDEQPVWTRFSPLARFVGAGPPYSIRVTSEDGVWLALASIDRLESRMRPPLELVFEARARLSGRVLDPDGKPVAGEWLQAWAPGASFESTTNRPLMATTKEDGRYDLRAIPPGRYTLKCEGKGFLPFQEEVEVPALARVERDLHLARPDPASLAPIRGRVTSQSGNYDERLIVLLMPEFPPRNGQTATVEWSGEAGAKRGSFEFKDLAPGDYTLDLRPGELVAVEPRKLVVQPSQQTLEFQVQDAGARAELHVRVLAAEDGAALNGFRLSASVQGSQAQTTVVLKTGETEAVLRGAPVGATLDLRVEMQGRQMLWKSVVVAEHPEPLVLKLEAGWGAELTVMGPKLEPLEGAKVFLDDELAGVADAKGMVRATRGSVPQKCRVEYRDWKMAPGGEVSPDTGQFRAWQAWIQVRMEPAK